MDKQTNRQQLGFSNIDLVYTGIFLIVHIGQWGPKWTVGEPWTIREDPCT